MGKSTKTSLASKNTKAKSSSKKPAQKTDADKICALEEQLAQREAEIARLLKETDQRATELQIINNIGQTLTEGLDLQSTLERVGDRLREVLKIENIAIAVADANAGTVKYIYGNRKSFTPNYFSFDKFKLGVRLSMRGLGRSWVVNTNVEKSWRKFAPSTEENEIPKTFILLPLLVGNEAIGGITMADFERENAFS